MATRITKSQLKEYITKLVVEQQSKWYKDELSDLGQKKFRVNFGQGQVSNTFRSRKEAEKELALSDTPKGFVQFKDLDTGEWFNVRHLKEQMDPQIGSNQADYELIIAEQEFYSYVSTLLYKLSQNLTKPKREIIEKLSDPVVFSRLSKELKKYVRKMH